MQTLSEEMVERIHAELLKRASVTSMEGIVSPARNYEHYQCYSDCPVGRYFLLKEELRPPILLDKMLARFKELAGVRCDTDCQWFILPQLRFVRSGGQQRAEVFGRVSVYRGPA